ncbi:MAG: hypothetical protein ACRDPZ_00915 [Gaiellaceae bacterium]
MSRTTIIVLVALGAAVAGFAFSSAAGRLRGADASPDASVAAGPQSADLDWRETFGAGGEQLVFSVEWLEVTRSGWRARIGIENDSSVAYELNDPRVTLDRSFGLMLFSSGEQETLDELNASGELPEPRPATAFAPSLPALLEPDASWEGTMSASGALVAGSWVRVVFGTLVAAGKPPDELPERIVWITDHTYRLRR